MKIFYFITLTQDENIGAITEAVCARRRASNAEVEVASSRPLVYQFTCK